MAIYKEFYQLLEEIRIEKGMSVSDLCDGIVSQRTYYRYLSSHSDIKFKIFSKLADRLKVELEQIVMYSIFFKNDDPGIIKFIYRVHLKHFNDIEPLYNSVKEYVDENEICDLMIKATVKKYEYLSERISLHKYKDFINEIYKKIENLDKKNIYILAINILYLEMNIEKENIDWNEYVTVLLENDYRMGALFSMIAIDTFLFLVTGTNKIEQRNYFKLVNKMKKMLQFFDIKYFYMRSSLYSAYKYLLQNKKNEMNEALYRYCINLIILIGGKDFEKEKNRIENIFKISFNEFLKAELIHFINSEQFMVNE